MKKYIATILPLFLVACGAPPTGPDNSEIISKAEEACLTTFPGEVMGSVDTKEFGITFVDTGELSALTADDSLDLDDLGVGGKLGVKYSF
jgi:hypothetical protein